MLALTPAYPFRPAGSRAISLIHVSQISGDHRQDEGRKRLPGATNAGHTERKDSRKTNPVPIRSKRQRTLEVVLAHQLDANSYALDGTPDALKQAQYHMRTAARLIDGYLGKKAA